MGDWWPIISKIVFLVLCVWLCVTRFKPLIMLYLVVKDIILMDKRQFRGYGFWLYCGLGGSGKTLSMVEYLTRVHKKYPKLKIYTNFRYKYADGIISSWQDIIDLENYELVPISKADYESMLSRNEIEETVVNDGEYYRKKHNGIIFGFDEIHLTFASQKWADCPDNMLEYISQQRKLHKQIVSSSQVFTRIDKKLREQTNFVIECKSLGGRWIFNRFFHTSDYLANDEKGDSGVRQRKRAKRYSFIAYDSLRQLYDTMQVMVNLKSGKSHVEQQKDILKRILED